MSRSIARQAFWGLGITLVILCIVNAMSYRAVHTLTYSDEERSRSFRLISAFQKIGSELQDADAAERGFLLTSDPRYLAPYNAYLANRKASFQRLRALASKEDSTTSKRNELEELVRLKEEDMQRSIRLRGSVGFDAAVQIILSGEGNKIMDRIRAALADLIAKENRSLALRDKEVFEAAGSAKIAMLLGTLAALLVAISAGLLIWGSLREREHTAGVLRRAHEGLEKRVEERTAELEMANSRLKNEVVIRQNAEFALEKHQHFLQAVLDSLDEGIVACDADGNILLLNPATRRLFGLPADKDPETLQSLNEVATLFWPDGITPLAIVDRPLHRTLAGDIVRNFEMAVTPPGANPRNIVSSAYEIRPENNERIGAVLALRDITEIKQTETATLARETAEASNRAKSEFLSRMSHELRTPLNAILGFAQLLQMDKLAPEQTESIDQILKGGRHLLALINEVLDISRIEVGKLAISPEPVLVSEAISEVVDLVAPIAKQRHVTIEIASAIVDERHVMADRQRIKQVLLNLLSNAVKYNHDAGWVRITHDQNAADTIRISVSDSGSGVPRERIHRLFTPFDRLGADQSGIEGTGLGLCLSKGLVELMGGQMGFETLENRGSTFWFELRAVESPEGKLDPSLHPSVSVPVSHAGSGKKVLYIEDNLSNMRLVERILQQRPGITVVPAMQGRLGVELAAQHEPDIIFLDLNLPDMHGIDVLRLLKTDAATAAIPVIVISADATPGQIEKLLAAGAQNYLTKPINVAEFLSELDRIATQNHE